MNGHTAENDATLDGPSFGDYWPSDDATVSESRHAFWGMDPSGYCICDDCNAPDEGAP